MTERLKRTEKEKIRLHFVNEPFYRLCREIHREFLDHRCTIPISPEELFIDASHLLDELISFPEKAYSRCENLWTDTFGEYRIIDAYSKNKDIIAEVAMIYTSLLETLCNIPDPLYHKGLMDLLYSCLCTRYVKDNKEHMRQICFPNYREFVGELIDWILVYVESEERLSEKIETLLSRMEKKGGSHQSSASACYFNYEGEIDAVMEDIFPFMQEHGLIAKETKMRQLKLIFMGKETSVVIKWTRELHLLTHLFKDLCDGENPPVTTEPDKRFKWTIVKRNFVDKEGNRLPKDIRSERKRTKEETKALIGHIVEAFRMNLYPKPDRLC